MDRPNWDEYFMQMAELAATRSTCLRRQVGAAIIKHKHVVATGYNGVPRGIVHCEERGGCLREKLNVPSGERHELCMGLHAEQNAIIQAGTHGINIKGATIYCTHSPCILCAKMLTNAGIVKFVMCLEYPDDSYKKLFQEANIAYSSLEVPDLIITQKK